MIHASRRGFLLGATALTAAAAAGCTPNLSFKQVQAYVATAIAALDKLAPEIEAIDPAITPQLSKIVADADAAAAAFAALSAPNGTTAQTVLALIEDGLTIAASVPGLPPQTVAIIDGVEILLVTVGGFFNLNPPPGAGGGELRLRATARLRSSSDAIGLANAVQAQIRAWLRS